MDGHQGLLTQLDELNQIAANLFISNNYYFISTVLVDLKLTLHTIELTDTC